MDGGALPFDENIYSDIMQDVVREFPRLAPLDIAVIKGEGPGYAETYPINESYNPVPGRNTIEIRRDGLTPEQLHRVIFGEALHLMKADPEFSKIRDAVRKSRSVEQMLMAKRRYERYRSQGTENRSFEVFDEVSDLDAFIRGYVAPDDEDEWRRSGTYTPEQKNLLEGLRHYMRSR